MEAGLQFEDRLDGISNYSAWNERIMLVLMENGIWEFTNTQITPPTDAIDLVIHNQRDVKSMCIILYGVKDHLISHLSRKKTTWDMWEALKSLFQSKNENHIMVLREKLRDTKMTRSDTVKSYLTRI
jgi:hypothetical protein